MTKARRIAIGLLLGSLVAGPALAQDTVPTLDELLAHKVVLKPELVGVHPRVFVTKAGLAGLSNPGPHGLSEVLYAFASAGNNNGSAFAGLTASTPFYDTMLGLCIFAARYWTILPVLAIAGSLLKKKAVPMSLGTLPTHTPLFVVFLASVVIIVGALTFFPAWSLGPIVEHLMMLGA